MSEHAWTQDHIAVAVAGGFDAADAERLDAHVRECSACAAALADARALDRGLGDLFTAARPGPTAEDRLIRSLWAAPARRAPRSRRFWPKVMWGVAASVGLGITGAGMSLIAGEGGLPFPGSFRASEPNNTFVTVDASLPSGHYLDHKPTNMPPDSVSVTAFISSTESTKATRDPEAMARTLRERTLSRETETAAPVVIAGGREFRSWGEAAIDSPNRYGRVDYDGNRANTMDGSVPSENGPLISNGAAPIRDGYPNTGRTPVVMSPDGGAVASSSGGDSTVKLWDAATGKPHTVATRGDGELDGSVQKDLGGVTFKPTDHMFKLLPLDNSKTLSAPVPTTVTKSTTPAFQYTYTPGPANFAVKADPAPAAPPEAVIARKIIRSGDIEFEIESFDSAVAAATQLIGKIKGGYIATVNSEKLANGKVRGSVVVRVPPDSLDGLVLDLRKELGKGGELKGQKIGSQDITKQYFDLESRLKAARTMETRLLQIIKDGKGEIKQLLDAEKELGVWRTRIEEYEGEIRFYASQVSLSTLTIALAEKEIKAAAGLTETEIVKTGLEVEDVDKALQEAIAAVTAAKGRVTKSEMKQLAAGQFNAILNFEVAPDAAGPLRDRLRQIGHMSRLEIDRVQAAEGGTPQRDAKVKRADTQFFVQLYNLVAVAARETAVVTVAAPDVAAAYQTLQDAVSRAKGRVHDARVDEQDRQNVSAHFVFEVRRGEEAAIQAALAAAGDVIARNVTRAPESVSVTDTKVLFRTTLVSATRLKPRETATLGIEVENVDATAAAFAAQMAAAKGRTVESHITHERSGRVVAHLVYDVPLTSAAGLAEQFKTAGTVRVQQSKRDAQAPEGKLAVARIDVTLSNKELIVAKDDGLWEQVRNGLSWSAKVLMVSVSWLIVGACVIVPWALVGYGVYRLLRRVFRSA